MTRTYSEAVALDDYLERFHYLELRGKRGERTFGPMRPLNQAFYRSPEWHGARLRAIARDLGGDMAHPDYPLGEKIIVHHINPITEAMIDDRDPMLWDLENLICVTPQTHAAIHYGDTGLLRLPPVERRPYDTAPWRRA